LRDSLWVKCLHWGHLSSLPLSEIVTTRAWYYYPKNRFCQKKNPPKVETRNPPQKKRVGTNGVDESVVQPAADEGEVQQKGPLISGRFFFVGDEAEAGSGLVVFHHSLRKRSRNPSARKPTFKPRLRFVPRFC
jgi:hypothetical protein